MAEVSKGGQWNHRITELDRMYIGTLKNSRTVAGLKVLRVAMNQMLKSLVP